MRILIIFISIHFLTYGMETEQTFAIFEKNYPTFFQNIKSLNLSNKELNSLYQHIEDYRTGKSVSIKLDSRFFLYSKNDTTFNNMLFFAWLFKEKLTIPGDPINTSGNYFFFAGPDKLLKHLTLYNHISTSFVISNSIFFNGKEGKFTHRDISNLTIIHIKILEQYLEQYNDKNNWIPNIIKCAKSEYKLHLMPTKESLYITVYKLCMAMKKNPEILKNVYLRDLIRDFKVRLDPYNDAGKNLPVIVIYIPTIFISDEELENLDKNQLQQNFNNYVDYTKSKQCLELLLTFLIQFFDEHKDCIGSGVIPRFNAKVTDMIFFAQGSGDDKEISSLKKYFEDDLIYFKAENREDFKVNIDALLKKALQSPLKKEIIIINKPESTIPKIPNDFPTNQLPKEPLHPSSNIQQPPVKIENPPVQSDPVVQNDNEPTITQSNDNVGGIDFFYSIKIFFYYLFQKIISFLGY